MFGCYRLPFRDRRQSGLDYQGRLKAWYGYFSYCRYRLAVPALGIAEGEVERQRVAGFTRVDADTLSSQGEIMDRRSFIADVARVCLCACVAPRLLAGQELAGGCAWSHAAGQSLSDTTSSSGNRDLDRALIAEVRKVDRIFQINPGYRFLRDGGRPNAYATPDTQVSGTWGTVVFGLTLISEELRTEYGGAAIAGIAGHEGAHIFQFRHNYAARLRASTARPQELHADYMAGYYFAQTGRTEASLVVFAESLFSKGDYAFNSPDHHGTPDDRVSAMRRGYAAGNNSDIFAVADQGVRYVTQR